MAQINSRELALDAISLAILVVLVDWVGSDVLSVLLVAFSSLLGFFRPILALKVFTAFMVLSADSLDFGVTQYNEALVTVHTVSLGITLFPLWGLLLAAVLALRSLKGGVVVVPSFDRFLLYLGCIFMVGAVLGLSAMIDSPSIYISDLSYFINVFIGYFLVRLAFHRRKNLAIHFLYFLWILIGLLALKGVFNWLLGVGILADHIQKPISDSMRNVFPLLAMGLVIFINESKSQSAYRSTILLLGVLALFNFLLNSSRGNYALTAFGLVLYMLLFSQSLKLAIKFTFVFFAISFVGVAAIWQLNPETLNFVVWKLSTFTGDSGSLSISSSEVRYLSLRNIVAMFINEGGLILGTGLGGYFTDVYYPFAAQLKGGAAFPDDWIETGRLYKPHGTVLLILLKFGFLGFIAYYSVLIMFWLRLRRLIVNVKSQYRTILVATMSYLPLLFYKNYTTKLQVLMGMLLSLVVLVGIVTSGANYSLKSEERN